MLHGGYNLSPVTCDLLGTETGGLLELGDCQLASESVRDAVSSEKGRQRHSRSAGALLWSPYMCVDWIHTYKGNKEFSKDYQSEVTSTNGSHFIIQRLNLAQKHML